MIYIDVDICRQLFWIHKRSLTIPPDLYGNDFDQDKHIGKKQA